MRGATEHALDRDRSATAVALALITAVAIALRFSLFSRVPANPFYDAAVRSMGLSWHNLLFGAFEPGGQVAIDKAPVDLWLQVASTKLLGFSSTALRLPEAIAGTLAVPLLFDVVRRPFGRGAGLASAAVLAVLPVSVLTSRSDTMDSLMALLLVAAAWMVVRGAETHRARWLVAGGAMLGLAFEVKLFEALVAAPALLALAALTSPVSPRRTLGRLCAAGMAFVGVGLAWPTAVSLLPGRHPWPIGATDGSVWNALFVYNGIDRMRVPPSAALAALDPAGPLRLFSVGGAHQGRLIGSTLIAALALGGTALAYAALRPRGERSTDSLRRGGVVWIALWLLTGLVLFSAMGRLHARYLEALTPAVAAAAGVGLAGLAAAARNRRLLPAVLLLLAATAGVVVGARVGGPAPIAVTVAVIALGSAAAGVALLAAGERAGRGGGVALLAAGALAAVLAVPAAGSLHGVAHGLQDSGRPGGGMTPARTVLLSRFLRAHQGGARYELASSTVAKAGPLIVHDARPVLMLTSLYQRPLLTPGQLHAAVSKGQVRYALLGSGTCSTHAAHRCPEVIRWARAHSIDVSIVAGLPTRGLLYRFTGVR